MAPLVTLPAERLAREGRLARDREAAQTAWHATRRRVFWQCVGLSFLGVPVSAWSWSMTDEPRATVVQALAFCISYVGPWARLLIFHVRESDRS